MSDSNDVSAGKQLVDDLKLQAWLARAEAKNPSLHQHVEPLAQTRDELRLQLQLGRMEAREEWHDIEKQWQVARPKLEEALEHAIEELDHGLASALKEIRAGYHRLRGDA
jgi:biopolymer transport protein ExbB/TolQ